MTAPVGAAVPASADVPRGSEPAAAAASRIADSVGSASATAARVAELRTMIAQVEGGSSASASFGAHLATATAASGPTAPALAATSSLPAIGPLTAGTGAAPIAGSPLPPSTPYAAQIEAAAGRHGVDPALLAGLIRAESNFDPNASSSAGAQGLTQLMPETARSLGVTDPFDPEQAIEGGARLLGEHLQSYDGNTELALAAYNAGPGAVEQYGGIPPYPETQAYVQRVIGYAAEYGQGGTGTVGGW